MDTSVLFFLSSGLFLGWALGANHLGNVFGTAVGTRMVRFATAAAICSVFVILGAVFGGGGAAHTLGKLGSVNALGGSFMAAGAAAVAVYLMTRAGIPVSTTQAIVGAIIGWNLFSETRTDTETLIKILTTWVMSPVLAAMFSIILFKLVTWFLRKFPLHLLRTDAYTRLGLLVAGAFGAYSLGANNIANVMGVFVASSPFTEFGVMGLGTFSSTQQLFLIGALAIAVGVFTYSKRVIHTVGRGLLIMSPIAAWVVVMAHSLVLFLFASEGLEALLAGAGLPTIPLVPVSSSEAVIGAVIGIGIIKGGAGFQWRILGRVSIGWLLTPIISGLVCFVGLFFMQNVFNQEVYRPVSYLLSQTALERLERDGVATGALAGLEDKTFESAVQFGAALDRQPDLAGARREAFFRYAEIKELAVDAAGIATLDSDWLSPAQIGAVRRLEGRRFRHKWMLAEALAEESEEWRFMPAEPVHKVHNKELGKKLDSLYSKFEVRP